MGEKMTLHDRVEFALRDAGFDLDEASRIATLAESHLTQPAQAVDVGAIREVIERLRSIVSMADKDPDEFYSFDLDEQANKLTAALSGKQP